MRMFLYYSLHSVKNQKKKLFKTWVAVFFLACILIGVLIGLGAAWAEDQFSENDSISDETVEILPEESPDASGMENELTPFESDPEITSDILELAVLAITVLVFVWSIFTGEKSGSSIFLMADVNLLFASPMRPQSVLMFRLMTQMGTMLLASVYLIFQLPNLMMNLGLGLWQSCSLFFAWFIILAYGKLISVLMYALCSTHESVKRFLRPALYAFVGILGISFFLYYRLGDMNMFEALTGFFCSPVSRYIPVVGWIKAVPKLLFGGEYLLSGILALLLIIGIAVLVLIIRAVKCDFYEDAMARSAETAELARAVEDGQNKLIKRKKDRSEALVRDRLDRGSGANIFFWKTMYNRYRFAHLKVLTKTTDTYLIVSLGAVLLMKFVFEYESFTVVSLLLGGLVFYRSLGNPVASDIQNSLFYSVPESMFSKLFYSLLGGSVSCLLDLLPGFILSAVLLGADPLRALGMLAFIVSVDFYSSNVGTFIDVSVPVSAGKTIKQVVQIMFIYFGLLPIAAVILVGAAFGFLFPALIGAAIFSILIGTVFMCFTPLLLQRGR
ncbi:MAG: hypothetical protein E7671_02890 [Ruminococcaceae bacterium]|nr:hypothetical protein [Oscillospiraceae bacterium]